MIANVQRTYRKTKEWSEARLNIRMVKSREAARRSTPSCWKTPTDPATPDKLYVDKLKRGRTSADKNRRCKPTDQADGGVAGEGRR